MSDTPENEATLFVKIEKGECRKKWKARTALDPEVSNSFIAHAHLGTKNLTDPESITEFVNEFRGRVRGVVEGRMEFPETMLASQAISLNALFVSLANRAGNNMGSSMDLAERYMRLALKAQSQCRTTLEAIAEIKNPRQVAFVRQANIAAGHQQINNGVQPPRAEESQNGPNELLGVVDGQWVEARAAGKASDRNPEMEAVARVDRSKNRSRKKALKP